MEVYTTEEEQLEAIKKWWSNNGFAVVLGVVLGLAGLFGWQAWQKHERLQSQRASTIYLEVLGALQTGNFELLKASSDELAKDYSGTPYAALASLAAAKAEVVDKNVEAAITHLDWVVENAKQQDLVYISKLRKARLQFVEGDLDNAMAIAQQAFPDSYSAEVDELLGDIYVKRGENALAKEAYDRALTASIPAGNKQMLQVKRDELGEADDSQSSETEESADA